MSLAAVPKESLQLFKDKFINTWPESLRDAAKGFGVAVEWDAGIPEKDREYPVEYVVMQTSDAIRRFYEEEATRPSLMAKVKSIKVKFTTEGEAKLELKQGVLLHVTVYVPEKGGYTNKHIERDDIVEFIQKSF